MGERDTTAVKDEPAEAVTEKALKAAKRRRAEERLEMLRLREELGDYDLNSSDEL